MFHQYQNVIHINYSNNNLIHISSSINISQDYSIQVSEIDFDCSFANCNINNYSREDNAKSTRHKS